MEFRILGSFEMVGPGGAVALGGTKRRGLLAFLLVYRGQVIAADRLVEELGGGEAGRNVATVQTYVSQLRKLFAGAEGVALVTRPAGYVLEIPADALDAAQFETTVRAAADETDLDRRVELCDAALGLWRGTPLEEFSWPWATAERARLEGLRVETLGRRLDARLERGEHVEVLAELERLTRENPLDERLWGQRMLACYRSGRQGDALRAFGQARRELGEDLGVEPGPDLVALERRILDHDPTLAAPQASVPAAPEDIKTVQPVGVATFLLTDIEGSTELWDCHPDVMAVALAHHEALIAETVRAHGGQMVKSRGEGDSTLSVFASPRDAAAAAVALQRALADAVWPEAVSLPTRVALHTGEAQLRDGDYYGGALNRAARIRALAAGGEILCSRTTADLIADALPPDVRITELGTHELKGLRRRETVHALTTADTPPGRVITAHAADHASAGAQRPAVDSWVRREPLGRYPFVGRARERDALRAAWQDALEARRSVVFLAGEPGVGKTRLAFEFAADVQAEGGRVLVGRCDDGMDVPYQPFVEALRSIVAPASDADLDQLIGPAEREVVRLLPELAARLRDSALPPSMDAETERYSMFASVVNLLVRASREQPTLLVLEDLQWAAPSTLMLLRWLAASPAPMHVCLIATYRDTDLEQDHPLVLAVADVLAKSRSDHLLLAGLATDDVLGLLEAALKRGLEREEEVLGRALQKKSGGNALFVTELIAHTVASSTPPRDVFGGNADSGFDVQLPFTIRALVLVRLASLSTLARTVLGHAAVIGEEFDLSTLAATLDCDTRDLLSALEEAMSSRLIDEVAVDTFRFAHALVRAALSGELSQSRRARLHMHVARAIVQQHADALGEHVVRVAHHYGEVALPDTRVLALEYAIRAGELAGDRLAHEVARSWFERALALLDDGDDPALRCEVFLRLGAAQRRSGDVGYRRTLLAAAQNAEARGDVGHLVRAALENTRGFFSHVGRIDVERVEVLEAAIAALDSANDERAVLLLAALTHELSRSAESLNKRRELSERAVRMARHLGERRPLAEALIARHVALHGPQAWEERMVVTDELMKVADERRDDATLRVRARWSRCEVLLEGGRLSESERVIDEALRVAAQLGEPLLRWATTMFRIGQLILRCRLDEAEAEALENLGLGRAVGQSDAELYFGAQLFFVRLDQGRLAELVPALNMYVAQPTALPLASAMLALAQSEAGDAEQAVEVLRALVDNDIAALPRDGLWLPTAAVAARASVRTRSLAQVERLVDLLTPLAYEFVALVGLHMGSVALILGELHTALGHWDTADELLVSTAERYREMGAPAWALRAALAHCRLRLARATTADRALALEQLRTVLRDTERLKLDGLAREAAMLQAET